MYTQEEEENQSGREVRTLGTHKKKLKCQKNYETLVNRVLSHLTYICRWCTFTLLSK